jgi:hypothetical protein
MPNQQSSFSGTRTALTRQLAMAATDAESEGPSKIPHPWIQAYSVPERSTPRSCTGCPAPLTSSLPSTRIDKGVAAPAGTELVTMAAAITENVKAATRATDTSFECRRKRRVVEGFGVTVAVDR